MTAPPRLCSSLTFRAQAPSNQPERPATEVWRTHTRGIRFFGLSARCSLQRLWEHVDCGYGKTGLGLSADGAGKMPRHQERQT